MSAAVSGAERCEHLGHHWHEPDGAVFARPRALADRTEYPVTCCRCGVTHTYVGYGARRAFTQQSSVLCAA